MSSKITALTTKTDVGMDSPIPLVDIHDTSMASSGTDKKSALSAASYSPATKVVAPSGSGKAADYYTTGTSDQTIINSAITAVNALGGGVVKLMPGYTFTISNLIIQKSGVTLEAYGATINGTNNTMVMDAFHHGDVSSVDHIGIRGGIWNLGTLTQNAKGMILSGNKLDVRDLEFSSSDGGGGSGFTIHIHNSTDFTVENIFLNTVISDGIHVTGPASFGTIKNIYGISGDDMVALLPNEFTMFTTSPAAGDITDILVENIKVNGNSHGNAVRVLGGTNGGTIYNTKRIKVKNITGSVASGETSGIFIGDDTSNANTTGGVLEDITLDSVSIILPDNTIPIVNLQRSSSSPIFQSLRISNVSVISDCLAVVEVSGFKVNYLTIDNISGSTSANPMNGIIYIPGSSTVTHLTLNNIGITFAGARSGQAINLSASGSVITNIYFSNTIINNVAQLLDTKITNNLYLSNVRLVNNSAILNIRSGSTVTIRSCDGIFADNTSESITSTGTLQSKSPMFPMNVIDPQVISSKGDMAYNTNSSAVSGVGPVAYDGVIWIPMDSLSFKRTFAFMGA